jgi:hypothetical protein
VTNVIDNFGIEAWVNPAASAVSPQIIVHNGAPFNGNGYGFEILNGNYHGTFGAFTTFDTGVTATPGVWRHLALVRASGVTRVYVDGVVVVQTSAVPATPAGSFTIGRAPGGTNVSFSGSVDDARIFTFAPGAFNPQDLEFNTPSSGAWSWSYTTDDGPAQSQEVTLTASTGVSGETTSLPFTLIVKNVAPSATLSNGGAVSEGNAGSVSFSGQSDPSTADTTAGFHYAYDFDNDGTFEVGDGSYTGSGSAASSAVPASFLADGPGSRMVRGRIIDKDDGFTDYTTTITINNAASAASVSGPSSALAGQLVTFVVGASDSSAIDQAAGFSYSIDWGDGSPVQTISRSAGNSAASPSHAYAAAGNYTIQVTATDKDGSASAPASAAITVNALTSSSLQALIGTTDIVYLAPANDAALHSEAAAINGLSAPASLVNITIILGDGPYTGVTLSPPDNIVLDLAGNHTADNSGTQITGASPAVTVTHGEVFVQGDGLTTATDSPTVLVTGGHLTIAQDDIEESTGFNNAAVALTGGTLTLGLDLYINLNGQGSFYQTYDPEAIGFPDGIDADLTPNTYAVDGTAISASEPSATDLESSANPSSFGQAVTFTAGIDVEADEQGPATGTVTFYDGAAVLGTATVSEVGFDVFEASFTTSSLSVGAHTIRAVYGGNPVYLASSATLTQQVGAFPFAGFFSPVDNPPTLNQVNAGQGIPFKFSLGGNFGLNIIASGYPVSQQVTCDAGAPVDDIEQTTTSPSGLTYDPANGQYTYTWKTQKSWANTCRQFTLRLTDGTDHTALFKFK